jgi:hypothetical protein
MLKVLVMLFFSWSVFGQTVNLKTLDFKVKTDLGSRVEYGMKFVSYKKRIPKIIKDFDVEGFSKGRNMLVFSKSAFTVDIPVDQIVTDDFFNPQQVAQVFDGRYLSTNGEASWNFSMKVSIKTIQFRLQAYLMDGREKSLLSNYIQAAEQLDTEFTAEYYVVQILDNFSEGVKRMVIVSKFIPVGEKTLVVSYHLSALDYRWYKKYNLFNMVKKIYSKRVVSTLERTKNSIR